MFKKNEKSAELQSYIEEHINFYIKKSEDIGLCKDDYETKLLEILSICGIEFSR